jgi:hypothetical protein
MGNFVVQQCTRWFSLVFSLDIVWELQASRLLELQAGMCVWCEALPANGERGEVVNRV